MLKNMYPVKSLTLTVKRCYGSHITQVQFLACNTMLTVAYLNERGGIVDAEEFTFDEYPDLKSAVCAEAYDDVWDIESLMALIDPISPDTPAPALAPLVPAYLRSIEAAAS